jgi:AcrR family transcriptional regulator
MEKALTPIQVDWRERKAERNRNDILEAAARAFSKKGLAGATMQDIAAEAGYTVPTLYSYFKGKDELVRGLLEMLHREALQCFDVEPAPGWSFAQSLELMIRHSFELTEKRRSTLLLLLELREKPPFGRDAHGCTGFGSVQERLVRWLRAAAGNEDFGGRPLEDVALALMGLWQSYFLSWILAGGKGRLVDRVGDIVQVFLHGVCSKSSR